MATTLACLLLAQSVAVNAQQQQQQAIPDAPAPALLQGVTPGKGSTGAAPGDLLPPADQSAPGSKLPSTPSTPQTFPADPEGGAAPEVTDAKTFTIRKQVNFVEIPFTVKDSKNQLVPGLDWREVRVYENNVRQHMSYWTVDPFPLSVALVIDQSLPFDTMTKVNNALGALGGAFTAYDEVAVFTYNNGPKLRTDFTAAQSARLGAVIEQSKTTGREAYPIMDGPLAQNTVINGQNVDPNTSANRGHQGLTPNAPREVHTLNDAILAAAVATTKAGKGRRRIVYVISDGKEFGSQAKQKDVIKYLQRNEIAVYGTLVGDSAIPGLGFLDRIHLPFQMRGDILPVYAGATGGQLDAENRTNGIEKSFAKIAEQVRTQYTVGYYTKEPFVDGKYRQVEIKVMRPNLSVISKSGYYPSARDSAPVPAPVTTTPPAVQ
jgi:VWFA-related protein